MNLIHGTNENTCNSAALIVIKHVVVIVIGKLVMNHFYFLLRLHGKISVVTCDLSDEPPVMPLSLVACTRLPHKVRVQ